MPVIPILLSDSAQQVEYKISLAAQVDSLQADYDAVALRRRYFAGDHDLLLNDDQQAFLDKIISKNNRHPVDNKVAVVVNKLRRRINVQGFAMPNEQASEEETAAAVSTTPRNAAEWAWQWWMDNKMDAGERELYEATLVDEYAFVSVEHNGTRPVFHIQKRYAGDGTSGVRFFWEQDTIKRNPLYAIKYWYTHDPVQLGANNLLRITLYSKDRIYKWIRLTDINKQRQYFGNRLGKLVDGESHLYEIMDEGDTTHPIIWEDSKGKPLGLAVIPFVAPMGNLVDGIIGLQDVLNKTWVDIIAVADQQGFGIPVIEYPGNLPNVNQSTTAAANSGTTTSDDGLGMRPARVLEVSNGAKVHKLPADDLEGLHNTVRLTVTAIASNSEMPLHYFTPLSGEVPSGAALDELAAPVGEQAEEIAVAFTPAWSEVMLLAQRVDKVFGNGYTGEPVMLVPKWKPQPKSPETEANAFNPMVQLTNAMGALVGLGASLEGAAAFLGVGKDKIKLLADTGEIPPPAQ